jgi:hypothetical protein
VTRAQRWVDRDLDRDGAFCFATDRAGRLSGLSVPKEAYKTMCPASPLQRRGRLERSWPTAALDGRE